MMSEFQSVQEDKNCSQYSSLQIAENFVPCCCYPLPSLAFVAKGTALISLREREREGEERDLSTNVLLLCIYPFFPTIKTQEVEEENQDWSLVLPGLM
jgi:hypothetical protein